MMNNGLEVPYDVVIVGSGYSGTMVAVHLARAPRGLRVALIDRSKTFVRGFAYGTTDPKHLLNVQSTKWARFPTISVTSTRWLKAHPATLGAAESTNCLPMHLFRVWSLATTSRICCSAN
jgi:uncharacterized NAD(P)/FAD-binding protein YdhS